MRPKSVRGILRYLGISTKRVYIMHELKAGLNADKFATFERFPKRFYHSFVLQMNHIGKTQCWALFGFSKATFTKTAIKPKFVDRFSLKNFSAAIDQCTIKSPELGVHWTNFGLIAVFVKVALEKKKSSTGLRFTDSHVNIIIKFSLCVIHVL